VAQLVEQRSPKPQVAGSSPVRPAGTKGKEMAVDVADEPGEEVVERAKKDSAEKRSFFGRIALFIRQVIVELKKVVTPTRKELINYFFVVLAFVVIMMLIVAGMDWVFGWLVIFVFGDPSLAVG
jgi:preprotein translocase subunit SecE